MLRLQMRAERSKSEIVFTLTDVYLDSFCNIGWEAKKQKSSSNQI